MKLITTFKLSYQCFSFNIVVGYPIPFDETCYLAINENCIIMVDAVEVLL